MLFIRKKKNNLQIFGVIPFYVFEYCFRTLAVFLFIQICLILQKPKEVPLDKSPAYNREGHTRQETWHAYGNLIYNAGSCKVIQLHQVGQVLGENEDDAGSWQILGCLWQREVLCVIVQDNDTHTADWL